MAQWQNGKPKWHKPKLHYRDWYLSNIYTYFTRASHPRVWALHQRKIYWLLYFLVDFTYPTWSIFVRTIAKTITKKEICCSMTHEALRKDFERNFEVRMYKLALLEKLCTLWEMHRAKTFVKASIVLQNNTVEWWGNGTKTKYLSSQRRLRKMYFSWWKWGGKRVFLAHRIQCYNT